MVLYIVGWHIGMYGLFKKAGITPWKALIPFYSTWFIVEKCNIKKIWFWLQFIPIMGQFITIWITIIFVMNFGKFGLITHTLVVVVPFIYLPYLGFSKNKEDYFKGEKVLKLYKKSVAREWVDAAVFAVVAATLIRTFIFEAYAIPSGSMEKTLLVNDYLFVNKMAYGPRLPITPVSFPFVHNIMPMSETQVSYSKIIQLPYKRLPGFTDVHRNQVVVFNFPQGDTIINLPNYGSLTTYYQVVRETGRDATWNQFGPNIIVHPPDKTDNYIKRCVAEGGDIIQVKDGILYVNNQVAAIPPNSQRTYIVKTNGVGLDFEDLEKNYGVEIRSDGSGENRDADQQKLQDDFTNNKDSSYTMDLTENDVAVLKKFSNVVSITPVIAGTTPQYSATEIFPYDITKVWSIDNYGPLYIPKKGATVTLTKDNISEYRRLITNYEGHTLDESTGQFVIDGKPTTQYTFKYNYYWMMGDNRHGSQDSRYWGFVPETHIVGRASFIMFSWFKGVRWKRMFKNIK